MLLVKFLISISSRISSSFAKLLKFTMEFKPQTSAKAMFIVDLFMSDLFCTDQTHSVAHWLQWGTKSVYIYILDAWLDETATWSSYKSSQTRACFDYHIIIHQFVNVVKPAITLIDWNRDEIYLTGRRAQCCIYHKMVMSKLSGAI